MYLHPSQLRVANTRRVFHRLLDPGPAGGRSRADLARLTGLSAVTAGKVVDDLIGSGLAEEAEGATGRGAGAGPMGRPPRIVRLSDATRFAALEIGVRESRVMLLRLGSDRPLSERRLRTPGELRAFVSGVSEQLRGFPRGAALLVSVPGVLDAEAQRVLFSPNLRWSEGGELLPALSRAAGSPVCGLQEIQALALGHQAGADAPESFVLVDFGDGVGGAVITGGELFHSPMPLSGELGHTGVSGNRRRCGCGSAGCLETLVSRRGLLETFRAERGRPRATWGQLAAHVRDAGVDPWLERSIDAAAVVVAGAINLLGIENVVLTGDLPGLHEEVEARFAEQIRAHALLGRFGRLVCRAAPRRRERGLIVAAADRILLPEPRLAQGEQRAVPAVG